MILKSCQPWCSSFTRLVAPIFEDNCGLLQWHSPPTHTQKKRKNIQAKSYIFPPIKENLQNLKKNHPNLSPSSSQNFWLGFVRFHDPAKGCRFVGHLHRVWINNACIAFKVLHIGTILGELELLCGSHIGHCVNYVNTNDLTCVDRLTIHVNRI